MLQRLFDIVSASERENQARLIQPLNQAELATQLNLDKTTGVQDWAALFDWITAYLDYSVNTNHLHFNNRMWSEANLPSILGEMVAALKNTSSCTYESAPVAVLMEQYMLGQMLDLVGFKNGEGQMTTGSSNANMIAMMMARNRVVNAKSQGLFGQKPLFAFVNEEAHYSFDKAVNILGIGTDNLIKVPTNSEGQISTKVLEQRIKSTITKGGHPFFIGATLGTTVRGAYDNIADLVPIKQKYNLWLHGDGAWGGAVIVNDQLRAKFIPKVAQLDSFTMDFHKMLGTALMCNFLLVNHQGLLHQTCANGDTSYIFYNPLDLGVQSLQCGRKVESLKWFLDWKFFKKSGFSERVMYYYQLSDYAEAKINELGSLSLVVERVSFNLCFRYLPQDGHSTDALNLEIRTQLLQQGLEMLSTAYIDDIFVFRLLMTHPNMTTKTIDDILNHIITLGDQLSKQSTQAV